MKPRLVAVILSVSSLALVGNAWGQPQGGQRQKSSMDTFLQWSSEQVNQLRHSCGRWMTEFDRRWSDSGTQLNDSVSPSARTQNQLPGNRSNTRQDGVGQGRQPTSGQGMGAGMGLGTGQGQGSVPGQGMGAGAAYGTGRRRGPGAGQAMGAGTAFGTGSGRGSGSGQASAFGNASGRGRRGNSMNGQGARGQGNGRKSNGRGRGKKVGI